MSADIYHAIPYPAHLVKRRLVLLLGLDRSPLRIRGLKLLCAFLYARQALPRATDRGLRSTHQVVEAPSGLEIRLGCLGVVQLVVVIEIGAARLDLCAASTSALRAGK
jgi:hypothetical protein